ncbi:PorP/SprF family type IX secretion system membrane protein [Pedobacter sp. MC2016-05]|uniref:PorP/SprF family type IX secretion system membrane protein n=1 Tax=Pedobacter sp. MC2016-05 TaxID=2994474 RepID=UPI0022459C08|nr:PorP/SprF family type IX secretion system membrane protein [Pedobacter sp. MC2016-05]MCX2474600.1 PorP/SprF family type IX secretion system membrane protein [Pedobacter sp. MC2016-05]
MYKSLLLSFLCLVTLCCSAQDPKFSQYFAAPLSLNPAFTGFFHGEYRLAVNTRQQWGNLGDPYNTYSVSGDVKLVEDENFTNSVFSLGLSGLLDESFNKALKSQYISASMSYYQYLDVDHRFKFGLAPQVSYVSRFLDYNKLTFASQYTDGGFDNSLPNYLDLKNDKTSYFDVNIGGNFSATFDHVSFVLGYAHYHLTKPQETLLNNTNEYVPSRQTVNFGMLYLLSNYLDLNVTGVYNVQRNNKDTILGTVVGLKPNDETRLKLNFGMWFKFNEASFYPYLGVTMGDVSAGLNYTVYGNKLMSATPRTYELSLIYRHNNFKGFKVPCPKF